MFRGKKWIRMARKKTVEEKNRIRSAAMRKAWVSRKRRAAFVSEPLAETLDEAAALKVIKRFERKISLLSETKRK
jgi:hypothetical protein